METQARQAAKQVLTNEATRVGATLDLDSLRLSLYDEGWNYSATCQRDGKQERMTAMVMQRKMNGENVWSGMAMVMFH